MMIDKVCLYFAGLVLCFALGFCAGLLFVIFGERDNTP